jgi:hypothetical protein
MGILHCEKSKLIVVALIGLFALMMFIAYPVWYGYFYVPFKKDGKPGRGAKPDTKWDCIPPGSVAFVLAFENLGEQDGVIEPGKANEYLADWLEKHGECFSLVLTQKAISDALEGAGVLRSGTPVVQMHRHDPRTPVRTLEALHCALDRFENPPDSVVLVAHDKQYERAFNDLRAIYPQCRIVNPCIMNVPYEDDSLLNPFSWAFRELYIARPADYFRRRLDTVSCPDNVRLGRIELQGNSAGGGH